MPGESGRLGQRGRTAGIVAPQVVQFGPESGVVHRLVELGLQLGECGVQGLGNVLAPEDLVVPRGIGK